MADIYEKLKEMDIDAGDGVLILSRKVQEGRSLCRLNGETCTAAKLREISSLLLDIHGQHEHQSLLYPDRQLAILDAYGKNRLERPLVRMEETWLRWKTARKELDGYGHKVSARFDQNKRRSTQRRERNRLRLFLCNPCL